MQNKKIQFFPVGTSISFAMLFNFPVQIEIDGKLQPEGNVRGMGGGKVFLEYENKAISVELNKITKVEPSIFQRS